MRKQFIAGAAALALATTMTTSAMAFGHGGGGGIHAGAGGFHAGNLGAVRGSYAAMPAGGAYAGHGWHGGRHLARGYGGYGYGGYFGPYYDEYYGGVGLAAADAGYCSPYSYDYNTYCGASYTLSPF